MRISSLARIAGAAGIVVLAGYLSCQSPEMPSSAPLAAPQLSPDDSVFTSTREVTCLLPEGNNSLWVGTRGGILQLKAGTWRKWTRLQGLPAHEVHSLTSTQGKQITARFPVHTATWTGDTWNSASAPLWKMPVSKFVWGKRTISILDGELRVGGKEIARPLRSGGTHVVSAMPNGKNLLVGIYGDGFWNYGRRGWTRAYQDLPENARDITCFAHSKLGFIVGTRRGGVFIRSQNRWKQYLQPDEPYAHNVQNLQVLDGVPWASTLEDGLAIRTQDGWQWFNPPQISTVAPRQVVSFNGANWIRHGDGQVDKWLNGKVSKNVFPYLPRDKALSLASDADGLYVGQWGGWSEWDGKTWTHRFDVPELKNITVTGIYSGKKFLWLLTQSRGLVRWDRSKQVATVYDERQGLPDDWITTVAEVGDEVYAGTFVGGLARLDGERCVTYPELKGENVTALEPDGAGGVWASTRHGVWRVSKDEVRKLEVPWLDEEAQALSVSSGGLWVGARTSLNWVTAKSLKAALNSP